MRLYILGTLRKVTGVICLEATHDTMMSTLLYLHRRLWSKNKIEEMITEEKLIR